MPTKKSKNKNSQHGKISDETREELWYAVSNLAAGEEHLVEINSKTKNEELRKDSRTACDIIRQIRQDIVTCGAFER